MRQSGAGIIAGFATGRTGRRRRSQPTRAQLRLRQLCRELSLVGLRLRQLGPGQRNADLCLLRSELQQQLAGLDTVALLGMHLR